MLTVSIDVVCQTCCFPILVPASRVNHINPVELFAVADIRVSFDSDIHISRHGPPTHTRFRCSYRPSIHSWAVGLNRRPKRSLCAVTSVQEDLAIDASLLTVMLCDSIDDLKFSVASGIFGRLGGFYLSAAEQIR